MKIQVQSDVTVSKIFNHECHYYMHVFIAPSIPCEEGSTRLVDGYLEQEGRLEICINGIWSTICDTGFEAQDALVACSTLGHDIAGRH